MASRNQNRPPRSPFTKKDGNEEVPLDKRRRIGGAGRMVGPPVSNRGRGWQAFTEVNNRQDVTATSDVGSGEGSECGTVEFIKEEVEALLNEKLNLGFLCNNKRLY
ncbi:kinesin-like protein KIN-14C isoform X2 [Fagus crenata]